MLRTWFLNLHLHFFAFFQTPGRGALGAKSHSYALRELLLQQATSEDSGHWDYALLMFYDELARSLIFSGFTALTDFGWSERAAIISADLLNTPEPRTLLEVCQAAQNFFMAFGKNILLVSLMLVTLLLTLPEIQISEITSSVVEFATEYARNAGLICT